MSINGQGPIVTTNGATVDRTITITNGGQGSLMNFTFYIKDGTGTLTTQLETAMGTIISPSTISGDTLFYNINSSHFIEVGDNNMLFEDGEFVVLKRTYQIISCDNDSYYQAYWGCPGACQSTTVIQQQTNIDNVVPNLVVSQPTIDKNYCFDGTNSQDTGVPVIQTFLVTNTGTGPATNFELSIYGYQPGSNTGLNYLKDEPWYIEDDMGTVLDSMTNFTSLSTFTTNLGDCTSATVHRSAKQTANSIIIQPGQSIYVKIPTYVPNLECNDNCPDINYVWYSFSADWQYQDQCENGSYGQTIKPFQARAHNFKNYTVEMPTDLVDEQEFFIDVDFSRLYSAIKSSSEGYNYFEVDYSTTDSIYYFGGPTITTPFGILAATENNSILSIRIPDNLSNNTGLLRIPMKAACGMGGTQTVNFRNRVKYDEACSGDGYFHYCQSSTFQMHCPGCNEGGATPIGFKLERINYGAPDNDDNHLPDATGSIDLSKINVHRAVNGDTIQGTWNILVIANGTAGDPNMGVDFNHVYVEFDLRANPVAGCNTDYPVPSTVFTALPQAMVTIYPNGGGAPTTCTVDPIINTLTAKYDLSPCKNLWTGGDSIVVEAKYIANASVSQSGFIQYIADNEVYSSYIPNPTGANPSPLNKYTCDHFNDYLNIFNIYHSPYMPDPQDINGCSNSFNIYMRQYVNVQANPNWFPYEYRPFTTYDEFKVTWPKELVYRSGSATFSGQMIPDADITQIEDTLTFSNLKQFYIAYGGTITPADETESQSINFSVDPSCDAEPGVIYRSRFKGITLGNGLNTPLTNWKSYSSCTSQYSSLISMLYLAPLPFFTGGGTEQISKANVDWDVILNNGSNSLDAPFSWFYLQDNTGTLSNFIVKQGATTINPDSNGFYQLGDNLKQSSTPYNISATSVICDTAKLNVIMGYSCSVYPTNTDYYPCADTLLLLATPLPSEVQIQIIEEPVVPLDLCTEIQYRALLSSAQAADLDNPTFAIKLPQGIGLSLVTPTLIEYPSGSGNFEAATTSQSNDTLFINLEDHSGIGSDGMPGTINALTPEERQAIVTVAFTTNCDFISGDYISFIGLGDRPCGDPANNNGVNALSSGLFITGAEQPYITNVDMTTSPNPTSCTDIMLNINLNFIGIIDNMTTTDDSIFITLPPGLDLKPSSLICTSTDCPIYKETRQDGLGYQKLIFAMPNPGIDITGGTPMNFSILLEDNNSAQCNSNLPIRLDMIKTLSSIACSTEPGGNCPSFGVLLGTKSTDILIKKAEISLNSIDVVCNASAAFEYSGNIQIDSVDIPNGTDIVLDIYCADALGLPDTYIESKTFSGPINMGTTLAFNGIIGSEICDTLNGVIFMVNQTNNAGDYQCICQDVSNVFKPISNCPVCSINSTLIENCNDNGTALMTDDYFTVDISATNTLIGSTNKYEIVYNGNVLNPGGTNYGTSYIVGTNQEFEANGGSTYTLTIRDIDKPMTCQEMQSIGPVDLCSTCDLVSIENSVCNNNGTFTTGLDDYILVYITATNISPGAQGKYEILYNGNVLNIGGTNYGNEIIIGTNNEFTSDGTSVYAIEIRDIDDPTCAISKTIINPGPCSTCPEICLPIQIISN